LRIEKMVWLNHLIWPLTPQPIFMCQTATAGRRRVPAGFVKFTPDGIGSVFAGSGLHRAFGLALDVAGNLYVSNVDRDTIEKFVPDGTDLGVFAYTYPKPHFMTMFRPSRRNFKEILLHATIYAFQTPIISRLLLPRAFHQLEHLRR
jgi:hypothetical protein